MASQANQQQLTKTLQDAIKSVRRNADSIEDTFVCEQDLRNVLLETHLENLRSLLTALGLKEEDLGYSCEKPCFLKVFAILVDIGHPTAFKDVRADFLSRSKSDVDLPLDSHTLSGILPEYPQFISFFHWQWKFTPFKIDGTKIPEYTKKHICPFLTREPIGSGSFGHVLKVRIVKGHLKTRIEGTINEDKDYACKILKNKADGEKELEALQHLERQYLTHENIIYFRAAFEVDGSLHIILPLAEWGNLDAFLHEQRSSWGTGTMLDALSNGSPQRPQVQKAMLEQLRDVTHGLVHLHTGLKFEKSDNSYSNKDAHFAHADLKPRNILIIPGDGLVVGRWCLSDFGMSKMYGEQHLPGSPTRLSGRLSPDASAPGGTITMPAQQFFGEYQAPEVIYQGVHKFSRRSDVWSMACIAVEVLSSIIGGADEVERLQQRRMPDPNIYLDPGFFEVQGRFNPQDPASCLRASVRAYLTDLSSHPSDEGLHWIKCAVNRLRRFLVSNVETTGRPSKTVQSLGTARPSSHQLHEDLGHICQHFILTVERGVDPEHICDPIYQNERPPPVPGSIRPPQHPHLFGAPESRLTPPPAGLPERSQPVEPFPEIQHVEHPAQPAQPLVLLQAVEPPACPPPLERPERPGHMAILTRVPTGGLISPPLITHSEVSSFFVPANRRDSFRAMSVNAEGSLGVWLTDKGTLKAARLEQNSGKTVVEQVVTLPLDQGAEWLDLACSGNYIVVLGKRSRRRLSWQHREKIVYACVYPELDTNLFVLDRSSSPSLEGDSVVVVVSSRGCVIVRKYGTLWAVNIGSGQPGPLRAQRIGPLQGHPICTDAQFDEEGQRLYSWSFGSPPGSVSVWDVTTDPEPIKVRSRRHFRNSIANNSRHGTVLTIPYNQRSGCILMNESDDTYCAVQPPLYDAVETPAHTIRIKKALKSRVFRDVSLVTVEKHEGGYWLVERLIEWHDQGDRLRNVDCKLAQLQGAVSPSSALGITYEAGQAVAVLGHIDGTVESVLFEKKG